MPILTLVAAALIILFGLRLTLVAIQTATGRKILARSGIRAKWQPAPPDEAWKRAFRDGLTGILLLVLGLVMMI